MNTRLRNAFLAPTALLLAALFFAPLAIILTYSFLTRGAYGGVTGDWTTGNYARLFDLLYSGILVRTLVLAGLATVICLTLAFPLALFVSRARKRKNLYLHLVMIPFWTSFLVRTYAWMFLLRDTGLINSALLATGVIREPLPLLYNNGAVLIGLVYNYLPFAVLPLYAALERLDKSILEAAEDLGARPWDSVSRIVIPACKPAISAAALLVFIPCFGSYLTPDLLGGGRSVMAGNLIHNQFTTARDWPFGSALALVLMAAILLLLVAAVRREKEDLL